MSDFKRCIDQTLKHAATNALSWNAPGGRAGCAAAGVDDWLVVIETAECKFLPDGLPLIPLCLTEKQNHNLIQIKSKGLKNKNDIYLLFI